MQNCDGWTHSTSNDNNELVHFLKEKSLLSFALKIIEIEDNGEKFFTKIPNPG